MAEVLASSQTNRTIPALLKLAIVTCFLRAAWDLVEVIPLMGYVFSGRISSPWFIYFLIFEAIAWVIIATAMWKLHEWSRLAAMILAGLLLIMGGRGLILMMMHRSSDAENYALVLTFILVDFFVIAYLAQPKVKELFEPRPTQQAAISK
ncbi:MAG TPA: hypothetical protein VH437_00350 [Terriglobales bacterium]|jgi:hypothetical protein